VAAAHAIVALQTAVSRLTDQVEPTVVTIGSIEGGSARNVIPERVVLRGTLRTLSEKQREAARRAIRQVVERTAEAFGARAEVALKEGYPVNVNDGAATEFLTRVAAAELGGERVRTDLPPSMGGEDFAYYLQRVPGAFWRLGVAPASGAPGVESLHHPAFDFPDEALATGVRMHCALARNFAAFVPNPAARAAPGPRHTIPEP
jgi:amidohydrolase